MKASTIVMIVVAIALLGASGYFIKQGMNPPDTYAVNPPQEAQADATAMPMPAAPTASAPTAPTHTVTPKTAAPPAGSTAGKNTGTGRLPQNGMPSAPGGMPRMGADGKRPEPPPAFALARTFGGIGRLAHAPQTTITKAQAKAILALMTPLRTQPNLTAAQATATKTKLEAILTAAQREELKKMPQRRSDGARRDGQGGREGGHRWGGGQGGPPQGGMGGPPPGGQGGNMPTPPTGGMPGSGPGGRMGGPPQMTKDFNPFLDSQDNFMAKRWQELFATLESLAQ
jgi:hypothetical protein